MQEKDAARIVKELISNLENKAEAFEETEEFKAVDEEISKILVKMTRTEEDQKKLDALDQKQEIWVDEMTQEVISSLKTQDMEEIISFINSNFIQENKIGFHGYDYISLILQGMIQEISEQNPDYANQLLQNKNLMEAVFANNNVPVMQIIFQNATDEDLLEQVVLEEAKNPRNRVKSSEENSMFYNSIESVIETITKSKTLSKNFKLRLLEQEEISLYLSGYTITTAIKNIGELTISERQQLLNNPTILAQLPTREYTQIIASSCTTLEDYEKAIQDERVNINYLFQGNHLSLEELETLLFTDNRYLKINEPDLAGIITTSHLPFEDRKKLLFDERIFSKLNDLNVTNIFISSAFTKEERENLFADQRIVTAIYNPATLSNNIFAITESRSYNNALTPEEKLAILTDKRIIEGISSQTIENLLADPHVSTEMATEVLFDKNLFYRLIKEYHPEYNPKGSKKGPFKYDKYEYIKLLYQKNPNIAKTLCMDLLDDKILDLGFDLIEKISKYHYLGTSVSMAYNGFRNSDSLAFEHILQTANEIRNANKMMIESLIPKILTIAADNSYFYEDPKKRTKFSAIRSVGKLDLATLTKEDWKTLAYIGFRDQSNYYQKIRMTMVGPIKDEIDITLNILPDVVTNDDLKDYEQRRQALCDTYFIKALDSKDLKQAQNAYLNKYYSINIEEAKAIVSMYSGSIESLSKNEKYNLQTSYILGIIKALNTTSLQGLQEIYQNKKAINFDDYIYMDQSIRQIFSEEMSESVYKITDKIVDEHGNLVENKPKMMSFRIEENGITTTKQVPVYEPGFDFKMLIHSTAAYGEMELLNNNYFDSWNKSLRTANHGICCSLIANDNLGMAAVKDVLLGFDSWDKKAISQSSPYDLHTYNDGYNLQEGHNMMFLTPQDIIDTTRHTHNEQTLERVELRPERKTKECPNIQPSYVIIYSDMEEEIKAKAVKCSEDMHIPIVYLDKEKIVSHEQEKLDNKIALWKETSDMDDKFALLEQILVSHENNRSGLRMTNPEWVEEYFPTFRLDAIIEQSISEIQSNYFVTGDIETYYKSSKRLMDILDQEQRKFHIAYEATSRSNDIDLPIEEYENKLMQVVDNQLGHDNSPKLERIVQSLEDNPTDENERKTILTAASSNLLEATKNLPELYQEDSKNHNMGHIERVIVLSQAIGVSTLKTEEAAIDQEAMDMLLQCAKYHDCGRENDVADSSHGKRSAQKMEPYLEQQGYSKDQIHMMQVAVEYHEYEDDEKTFDKICKDYHIPEDQKERTKQIATCLKDADALDRVRFHNESATLDRSQLRTTAAQDLISTATKLVDCYTNYDKTEFKKKCQEIHHQKSSIKQNVETDTVTLKRQ